MRNLTNLVALMCVALAIVWTPMAFAQDASADAELVTSLDGMEAETDTDASTDPNADNPDLYPIKSVDEAVRLYKWIRLYYDNEMQRTTFIEGQATPALKKMAGAKFDDFNPTLTSFNDILSVVGGEVPAELRTAMMAYLKSHGCEQSSVERKGKTYMEWNEACYDLFKKIEPVAQSMIDAMPEGQDKINATRALQVARNNAEYHPEDGGEMTKLIASSGNAVILAHGFMIGASFDVPDENRPWAALRGLNGLNGLDRNNANYLIGKEVCVYRQGSIVCDKVADVTDQGIIVGDILVSYEDAEKALVMGTLPEGALQPAPKLHLTVRGFMRMGNVEQYEGFTSNTGGMVVGRYNVHPNIGIHLGLGMGTLTGRPTLGVNEADSRLVFNGMAGARFTLGKASWKVAPIAEANLTIQGKRPGAEAGLGVEFFRQKNFDLSALATYGFYPTGQELYSHPDRDTKPFTLSGFGFAIEAGFSLF